jgi:hypothetical protein
VLEDAMADAAQGAKGGDAHHRVGRAQLGLRAREALGSQLRQQPEGAGTNVGVGVIEQRGDGPDGGGALGLEPDKPGGPDVDGWTLERGDLAGRGGEVEFRDRELRALGGDAINRAGEAGVESSVSAGAGIEPIGNVDGAVGPDGDVGRTKPCFQVVGALFAAGGVDSGEIFFLVGGKKAEALEFIASAFCFGKVSEDDVARGFTAEENAPPLGAEFVALVGDDTGGSTIAVDIAGGNRAGIFLPPLGDLGRLAGALVGAPTPDAGA